MAVKKIYRHEPDYAIPPGETLLETIEHLGMTQAELAKRMDRPLKTINEIIKGKAAITAETSLQLERVLGVPANFWNNLERNYRQALAMLEEVQQLEKDLNWLDEVPVNELVKRGWVPRLKDKAQQLLSALNFFGVSSPNAWRKIWSLSDVSFRQSSAFTASPGAVAAWLRIGELKAQKIHCQPYDKQRFEKALKEIRLLTLTAPSEFLPRLISLCADAGVAVVFEPELPKTFVCGATRWLNPNKALIQLSLRYKTDDHLWFTFFHEAGHILLHGKKEVFLEVKGEESSEKEKEADKFASEFLIPSEELKHYLMGKFPGSKLSIEQFASALGIAPGIVVGRLQHIGKLPHAHCNDLKQRFEWDTSSKKSA